MVLKVQCTKTPDTSEIGTHAYTSHTISHIAQGYWLYVFGFQILILILSVLIPIKVLEMVRPYST